MTGGVGGSSNDAAAVPPQQQQRSGGVGGGRWPSDTVGGGENIEKLIRLHPKIFSDQPSLSVIGK